MNDGFKISSYMVENPTAFLRFYRGKLQQKWEKKTDFGDPLTFRMEFEWRDVEEVTLE
jgi:hypothetical protein